MKKLVTKNIHKLGDASSTKINKKRHFDSKIKFHLIKENSEIFVKH